VDVGSGVGGFIFPGDRVDVVLTFDARQLTQALGRAKAGGSDDAGSGDRDAGQIDLGPAKYSSETVLKAVRVLAIDQNFKEVEGEASVAKSATLEVSPKQAEVLAVARAMGKLSLTLRSRARDVAEAETGTYTSDVDVSPTLRKIISQLAAEEKRKRSGAGGSGVRVFRGGTESKQEFQAR